MISEGRDWGSCGLIGREREVSFLVESLQRLRDVGRFIVLRGPSGIGKTALLDTACDVATSLDYHVLRVAMGPEASGFPFAAVTSGLRKFLDDHGDPDTLLQGLREDLSSLLPEHAGNHPPHSRRRSNGPLRTGPANQAVCELLRRLAKDQPTLVVLDDLQWADRSTLSLARWAIRQLRRERILFLVGLRDGEPSPTPEVLALASIGMDFSIGPLSDLQARRLLAESLSAEVTLTVDDATIAIELANGNPLYVIHAAHALSDGLRATSLASDLDAVLRARVSALPEGLRETLAAAAVAGFEVDIELVAAMLGEDSGKVVPHLRQGVRSGFLKRKPGVHQLHFAHPLARQAVLEDLLPPELRTLHSRALRTMRSLRPGSESARLALHARGAGDFHATVQYAEEAAIEADSRGAFHEASKQYDQLLAAYSETGAAAPNETLERAAKAWLGAGRSARAASTYLELADRYGVEGRIEEAMVATAHSVRANPTSESIVRLQGFIEQADPASSSAADALALATWSHVQAGTRSAGSREIVEASERALKLARTSGSSDALATALLARGHILANAFDFEGGCKLLTECLEVAHMSGAAREEHAAAINLASLLTKACRWEDAARRIALASERAFSAGAYRNAGQLLARLSDVEQWSGDWSAARAAARDSLLITDEDDPQAARAARYAVAHCDVLEHKWAEAGKLISPELQKEPWTFFPHGPFLALEIRRRGGLGDDAGAQALAESLHGLWLRSSDAFYGIGFAEDYVSLLCGAGRRAEAKEVLAQCEHRLRWLPPQLRQLPKAAILMQRARLALSEVDHATATNLCLDAAAVYLAAKTPYKEARALFAAANSAIESGDRSARSAARGALARSHHLLTSLGSPEARDTERVLRKLHWMNGASRSRTLLSRREAEIAELVAEGLSNQEIASQLYVSKRTVDNHLARMFEKAQVHSRTALAREVRAGRLERTEK